MMTVQKKNKKKIKNEAVSKIINNEFFAKSYNFLKSIKLFNIFNILLLGILIFVNYKFFFNYPIQFFPDSALYYTNAKILLGLIPFGYWYQVRGFGFPLIISLWLKLWGDNHNALLYGCYSTNIIFLLLVGIIIQFFIKKNKVKNYSLFVLLYSALFILNPLIMGYNHTLLTECVIPLLYLTFSIACYFWITKNLKEEKRKIILLNIIFIILGIMIWFIKQPFAPAFFATYLVSAICSGIYFKNLKIFLQKLLSVVICFIVLIISINIWNIVLYNNSGKSANDLNYDYMTSAMLSGINVYYYPIDKDNYCNNEYINNSLLSEKDKNKINNIKNIYGNEWCEHIHLYEIKNESNELVANDYIITKDTTIGVGSSTLFLIKQLFSRPNYIIKSYFYNYLAIADIQERDYSNGYRSSLIFSEYIVGENLTNGTYAFVPNHGNILTEGDYGDLVRWGGEHPFTTSILNINMSACFYLYKVLTLIIIFIFCKYFIKFIKTKNVLYLSILILSSVHMFNTLFHVFVGAIIDRYVYPSYTLALLAAILILISLNKSEE